MRLIDADRLKEELSLQWLLDVLLTKKNSADVLSALAEKIDSQPTAYGIRNEAEVRSERECLEQIVSFIRSEIDTLQLLISAVKDINAKIDRLANEIKSL